MMTKDYGLRSESNDDNQSLLSSEPRNYFSPHPASHGTMITDLFTA
jgi:hypothetical protein